VFDFLAVAIFHTNSCHADPLAIGIGLYTVVVGCLAAFPPCLACPKGHSSLLREDELGNHHR
jgi:hypothetical protein